MTARLARTSLAVPCVIFACACTGVVNPGTKPSSTGVPPNGSPGDTPLGAASGNPNSTTGTPAPTAASGDPFAECTTGAKAPGPAPLARLTTAEYRNTLADLFPTFQIPVNDFALPGEVETEGFTNNAATQTPSAALIEALAKNAHTVGTQISGDLSKFLPCTPASPADETVCGHQFVAAFGKQAFRGAFEAGDVARYGALFDTARASYGFADAVRMVLEAMLESPKFLYRLEAGGTEQAGAIPLTSLELAARLSYFLTDSTPDATLLDAASQGTLIEPATLQAQARRLLDQPSARKAIATFNSEWLRLGKLNSLAKAPDLFPSFTAATADSMRRATAAYVDHIFWDKGFTLDALLTDSQAYVDTELAPIYGVKGAAGSALSLVSLDPTERAGILTQAGLLAGFAHERNDAPVLRGVFVLDRFLCSAPPPPPPGVSTALPMLAPGQQLTTRQQLEQSHAAAPCLPCHQAIDGIGFGFEKYDAIGQRRTTEFGLPVDDRGEIKGTDSDGPFTGAVELANKLAGSPQVARCASTQLLRYALGVTRAEITPCMLKSVVERFETSGRDFRELLLALVSSDAFRYRSPN